MNKLSKILTIFLALFLTNNVFADCDDTTRVNLSKKAANIKMIYEVETGELDKSLYSGCDGKECTLTYEYFKMSILNLDNNFEIKIRNNLTSDTFNFGYTNIDSNGIVSFDWKNVMKMTTFTIDIYASNSTSCSGEKLMTNYLTTPRKNEYASMVICDGYEDYYLCEDYVTYDELDMGEFYTAMNKYKEEKDKKEEIEETKEKSFWNKVLNFLNNYKLYFIIGGTIVILGFGIFIIVRKRRN